MTQASQQKSHQEQELEGLEVRFQLGDESAGQDYVDKALAEIERIANRSTGAEAKLTKDHAALLYNATRARSVSRALAATHRLSRENPWLLALGLAGSAATAIFIAGQGQQSYLGWAKAGLPLMAAWVFSQPTRRVRPLQPPHLDGLELRVSEIKSISRRLGRKKRGKPEDELPKIRGLIAELSGAATALDDELTRRREHKYTMTRVMFLLQLAAPIVLAVVIYCNIVPDERVAFWRLSAAVGLCMTAYILKLRFV